MKYFFALIFMLQVGLCQSQTTVRINLDGNGMLKPGLPDLLRKNDQLLMKTTDNKELFDQYRKSYKKMVDDARARVQKLMNDPAKMQILVQVYGITAQDISNVLKDLNKASADQFVSGLMYLPAYTAGDKNYYKAEIGSANVVFPDNTESAGLVASPATDNSTVELAITRFDPLRKLTYNWLGTTKAGYPQHPDLTSAKQALVNVRALMEDIRQFFSNNQSFISKSPAYVLADTTKLKEIARVSEALRARAEEIVSTLESDNNLKSYKQWVLNWIWYQPAVLPQLNPFRFKQEENFGPEPDTSMLKALRLKIQTREEAIRTAARRRVTQAEIDKLTDELVGMQKQLDEISAAARDYYTGKAKNEQLIANFGTTSSLLNQVLFTACPGDADYYYMRHHDAAAKYRIMNAANREEYREDEQVVILAHNLKPDETAELNITFTEVTDQVSMVSEIVSPVIAKLLDAATSLGAFGAPGFTENEKLAFYRLNANREVSKLRGALGTLSQWEKSLKYMLSQSFPVTEIEETVDKTKALHSEISNPPQLVKGSKKATYQMKTKAGGKEVEGSAGADSFSYQINKFYRVFPMAGYNYTINKFAEAENGKLSELPRGHFAVGVKIYFLQKTNIRNTRFAFAKDEHGKPLWKSRVSAQVSFDVIAPLRNIYGGVGLDVWPGISIGGGFVTNRYKFTEYSGGQPIRTSNQYRMGGYAGISMDISLFTDVIKLLKPSK